MRVVVSAFRRTFVTLVVVVCFVGLGRAQSNASLRFEVASIKPNKLPLSIITANQEPGGRFVATNQSLKDLIGLAYKIRDSQIVGGPAWISADRFDINARADRELPPFTPTEEAGPLEQMLQSLLADRFKLVAHRETRELPIFALVLARSDGRPGEKLRRSSTDCAAVFADRARAGQPGPLVAGDQPTCGMVVSPWSIQIGGGPLSQLTMVLTNMTNRFVVDRTGLNGNYDVDLQWTPQGMRIGKPPGDNPPGPAFPAPPPDANGATLETAIQEQLGLKLDPQRGPVPVLVIERADQPTPD